MNERLVERKFYHDLINLASSARGISEVIKDVDENVRTEMLALLGSLSETMIEAINLRRLYCGMIANDLKLNPCEVDCVKLIKRLAEIYTRHPLAENKKIVHTLITTAAPAQKILLKTDKDMLQGALGYGIRTALEAAPAGATITLTLATGTCDGKGPISFTLTFPAALREEEKTLVFKRPEGVKQGLTSHNAYVFHALITQILQGSVNWTIQDGTVTLEARFE